MQDRDLSAEPRALVKGAAVSVAIALVVLLVAVLPAEYGVDPTGIGRALGFTRLAESSNGSAPPTQTSFAELYSLRAEWRLIEVPFAERTGTSSGAYDTTRVTVPVQVPNLTSLSAHLAWGGEGAARFDLRVVAPDGRATPYVVGESAAGNATNVTATLVWRSAPFPTNGTDQVIVPLEAPDLSAAGNWTVEVRLLSATGTAGPERAWSLRVTGAAFEASVRVGEGVAGDRVTLRLEPDRSMEYKFQMAPNATLEYAWDSTSAVYWDLHAERGGDADQTVSFQTGTSDGASGTLTAEFAGTHGWFWRNTSGEAVVITLVTRGDYEIVGVP